MKALSRLQLNMLHASQQYTHYPTQIGCFLDLTKISYDPKTIESFFYAIDEINQTIDMTNSTPVWVQLDSKPALEYVESSDIQSFFETPFSYNQPWYRIAIEIETHRLVFVASHVLLDGTSIQLLMNGLYHVLQKLTIDPFMKHLVETPIQLEGQRYYEEKIRTIKPTFIKPYNHSTGVHNAKRQRFILDLNNFPKNQPIALWIEAALALYIQYLHPNKPIRYGKILSQRRSKEKTALGLFSQAYPIHLYPSEFRTIESFITHIEISQKEMFRRRFIDFESLLNTSKIHHQTAQLFDVTFINQSLNYEENIPIEPLFYPYLDQALVINVLSGTKVILYFDYQVQCYSDVMIERLFKRIEYLLQQMTSCKLLTELDLLFPDEKPSMLSKTVSPLLNVYYQNLQKAVNQIAIIEQKEITYEKLEIDSNRLSHVLRRFEEEIIIRGDKTYESILMMLAAIKAGKPFVFSTSETRSLLDEPLDINKLSWSTESPIFKDYPKSNILAYYFTSGTTGRKKIAITHEALANHLTNTPYILYAKSLNRIPLLSALHFDMSLEEIWVAFTHKLTLVIFNDSQFKQPQQRAVRFQQNPIDGISTTPSIIGLLLDQNPEIFTGLKWVVLGGEVLTPALAKRLLSYPDIKLYNSYGPTEATIAITSTEIHSDEGISIGIPHPNTQVVVFDERVLPWGEIGEIYVHGISVSPTVNTITHEGLSYYPTSDIGYQDEQGIFHFIGRKDRTIKRHGVRIDLNWIDYILQKHPCITQATSRYEHNQIIAYIIADGSLDESSLMDYLSNYLSPNQRPNRCILTNQITEEGKIQSIQAVKKTRFKPINLKEKAIHHALSVVLNQSEFYLEDTIAYYGADSLSVIQILSILDQYGYELSLDMIESKPIQLLSTNTRKRLIEYRYLRIPNQSPRIEWSSAIGLFGANGFLGIHLLDVLIRETMGYIICPLRVTKEVLESTYHYYLNRSLDMKRVIIVPFNTPLSEMAVQVVINASGYTKYLGKPSDFDEINVDFVLSLGSQASALNIPLVHISTLGIGIYERVFHEDRKRLRMTFSNSYLSSKVKAEMGLSGIPNLQFKLIRVGNLTPSTLTMIPQLSGDNAFMKGLSNLIEHKNSNLFGVDFDITPVDVAAQAILKIMTTHLAIGHVIHPSRYDFESLSQFRECAHKHTTIQSNKTNREINHLGYRYKPLSKAYLKEIVLIAQKNRDS
jgi:non-ribosomal peptide synthetase component F/nucleoside-diphosphate-sugar epimerase